MNTPYKPSGSYGLRAGYTFFTLYLVLKTQSQERATARTHSKNRFNKQKMQQYVDEKNK